MSHTHSQLSDCINSINGHIITDHCKSTDESHMSTDESHVSTDESHMITDKGTHVSVKAHNDPVKFTITMFVWCVGVLMIYNGTRQNMTVQSVYYII